MTQQARILKPELNLVCDKQSWFSEAVELKSCRLVGVALDARGDAEWEDAELPDLGKTIVTVEHIVCFELVPDDCRYGCLIWWKNVYSLDEFIVHCLSGTPGLPTEPSTPTLNSLSARLAPPKSKTISPYIFKNLSGMKVVVMLRIESQSFVHGGKTLHVFDVNPNEGVPVCRYVLEVCW